METDAAIPVGFRWLDLSIDEVYELPKQITAKAWEMLCLMVEEECGVRATWRKLTMTADGAYEANGCTMAALRRRRLVRRDSDGLWWPTSRGKALVKGQLFR